MQFVGICIFVAMGLDQAHAVSSAASKQHGQETVSSKEFSYQIGPAPAFVDQLNGAPSQENAGKDLGDALLVLYDRQVSLLGPEPEEYVHYESKPLTASALQDTSQVYITFNPAYQKLVLHSIRVWRDGKAIDLTHSVKLDLMRRENNLEKNMYEGNVTAVGVLPDIRVNDVIDMEYTVSGANPIFGKRFADIYSLTQSVPVGRYRLSLVTTENRPINVHAPLGVPMKESRDKGLIRYVVEQEHLKPALVEDKMPEWYQSRQLIQVSEYQDWAQVSSWANDLFKVDGTLSPEIQQQIQSWKNANLPKDQLTVEVLRWVQSQIRYFGIELGVNSHLPAPPNVTVERKFGDCKDKSLLLATLLKALGIDAEPTLASVSFRRNVENMMPSPALFDHAIVKVVIDGKVYWLDPTAPPQYGKPDKLGVTDFGGVLVLGENSKQLQSATYPANFDNHYRKTSHFVVSTYNQPVQLTTEIKTDYNLAEYLRNAHEHQSKDEFNKIFQGDMLRLYPKAQLIGDIDFLDDKINNQVIITLKYSIEDFFHYTPGRLTSPIFAMELLGWATLPNVSQRSTPYALREHSQVIETIEVVFPDEPTIKADKLSNTKAGEFWTLTSSTDLQPQKLTQTWTLKANKEAVPPQKISEYATETKGIREQMGMSFKLPVGSVSDGDKQKLKNSVQRLVNVYGNSTSGRVGAEMKDAVNLILTTRDIASAKLGGKQLAEAYKIRSQAYDDQGDIQHALEDIRMAIKLNPDNVEYILSEADTLLGDSQFAAANQLYEQAIQMGKSSGANVRNAFRAYGESLHYLGQHDKAKEMLDEALHQESGTGAMYTAIWRYIASGSDADATTTLQSTMSDIQDRSWPYPVGELLLGKMTPEQLINAANSQDKGVREDQYCEAYFYLGQKYLLDKNQEKAKESFQKSLDQGVMPFVESNFSLYELGKKKAPKKDGFWQIF